MVQPDTHIYTAAEAENYLAILSNFLLTSNNLFCKGSKIKQSNRF